MGSCASKPPKPNPYARRDAPEHSQTIPQPQTPGETSTRRPFPPPSPAKHSKAVLLRGHGAVKPRGVAIKEGGEEEVVELDKSFGLSNKFARMFEVGEEVGRGHFWYTCRAIAKKGELKGQKVAVKIIAKSKMTTVIAIEDIQREVKILQTLTRHPNLPQFYDAYEDTDYVYIVTELCEGGELLDRTLARDRKYSEDYAKAVIMQILNVVAFLHLHGVVHRDIKPENFLFTSKDENSQLKVIDFGLSDFVRLDKKLHDIVGSAYYVAPEVLDRSYGTEADVWSVGVIAYTLLCGGRPFWARTESGIFQEVKKASPSFDENPWPSLSPESKDFVRCLLQEDPSRRITAAQALCHPWLQTNKIKIPLDIIIFRLMEAYMRSSSLRKAALRALSKTLTEDEVFYLREQYALMLPDERGGITLETIRTALKKSAPGASESHIVDLLDPLSALQYRRVNFEEFCAAALSLRQLEVLDNWEERKRCAYEIFEGNGNRVIIIEELASELGLSPSVTIHAVLQDWVRHSDGKLTFLGFVKLLLGKSTRSSAEKVGVHENGHCRA